MSDPIPGCLRCGSTLEPLRYLCRFCEVAEVGPFVLTFRRREP